MYPLLMFFEMVEGRRFIYATMVLITFPNMLRHTHFDSDGIIVFYAHCCGSMFHTAIFSLCLMSAAVRLKRRHYQNLGFFVWFLVCCAVFEQDLVGSRMRLLNAWYWHVAWFWAAGFVYVLSSGVEYGKWINIMTTIYFVGTLCVLAFPHAVHDPEPVYGIVVPGVRMGGSNNQDLSEGGCEWWE